MAIRRAKVIELGGIRYKVLSDDLSEEDIVGILRRNAAHVQIIIDQLETIKMILCTIGGIDLRGKPIEKKLLSIGISNDIPSSRRGSRASSRCGGSSPGARPPSSRRSSGSSGSSRRWPAGPAGSRPDALNAQCQAGAGVNFAALSAMAG